MFPSGVSMNRPKLNFYYNYEELLKAYLDCRRLKRRKKSAVEFEVSFELKLRKLLEIINNKEYKIGRTEVFVVEKPKPREIWAAEFVDRIVHHLVYNDIGEFFEKQFIADTFSCIKGRGCLFASDRLDLFVRKASNHYDKETYFLQFDIKNFFVSINKDILCKMVVSKIGEESLTSQLISSIIYNDPTENAIIKSNSNFEIIPRHKSLWNQVKNKGLPIGNLTSQFFSNIYLDKLDKMVKHKLKAKYYVRYVDDAVIVSNDKDYLLRCLEEIKEFLIQLDLELHPDKIIIDNIDAGINFVGYIIKPYRRTPRPLTLQKAISESKKPLDKISIPRINSYLGFIRHGKTYKIRKKICENACVPFVIGCDENYTKLFWL